MGILEASCRDLALEHDALGLVGVDSVPSMKFEKYASQNGSVPRRAASAGQRGVRPQPRRADGRRAARSDGPAPWSNGMPAARPSSPSTQKWSPTVPSAAPTISLSDSTRAGATSSVPASASAVSAVHAHPLGTVDGAQVVDPVGELALAKVAGGRSVRFRVGRVLSSNARGTRREMHASSITMSPSIAPGPLRETTTRPGSSRRPSRVGSDEQVAVMRLSPYRGAVGDDHVREPSTRRSPAMPGGPRR